MLTLANDACDYGYLDSYDFYEYFVLGLYNYCVIVGSVIYELALFSFRAFKAGVDAYNLIFLIIGVYVAT